MVDLVIGSHCPKLMSDPKALREALRNPQHCRMAGRTPGFWESLLLPDRGAPSSGHGSSVFHSSPVTSFLHFPPGKVLLSMRTQLLFWAFSKLACTLSVYTRVSVPSIRSRASAFYFFSEKNQIVNILGFQFIWSLSCLLNGAIAVLKQPWRIRKWMGVVVFF